MPIPLAIPAIASYASALKALGATAIAAPTLTWLYDNKSNIPSYINRITSSAKDDVANIIALAKTEGTYKPLDEVILGGDIRTINLPYQEVIERITPPSSKIQIDLSRTMDNRLGDAVRVLTGKATVTNNTPSTNNTPENEEPNETEENKPQDNKPNENSNKPKKNLKERIKEWRDSEIKWTAPTSAAGKLSLRALPYIGEWYPIAEIGSQIGKKLNWNEDSLTQNIIDLLKRDEKSTQKTWSSVPVENAVQTENSVTLNDMWKRENTHRTSTDSLKNNKGGR